MTKRILLFHLAARTRLGSDHGVSFNARAPTSQGREVYAIELFAAEASSQGVWRVTDSSRLSPEDLIESQIISRFAEFCDGRRLVASNCRWAISLLALRAAELDLRQDKVAALIDAKGDCLDIENSGWKGDVPDLDGFCGERFLSYVMSFTRRYRPHSLLDMTTIEAVDTAIEYIIVENSAGRAAGLRESIRSLGAALARRIRRSAHSAGGWDCSQRSVA